MNTLKKNNPLLSNHFIHGALAALVVLTASIVVGCSSKSKSGDPTPTATTPATPTCATNQILHPTQNVCWQQCGLAGSGYGIDPATNQCVLVQATTTNPNNTGINYWNGPLIITKSELYKDFLQEYGGFCSNSSWIIGASNCSYWDGRGYLRLQSSGTTLPTLGYVFLYPVSDAGVTAFSPISIGGNLSAINDNQGFEIRQTGYYGTPSYNDIIRVIADPGLLTDQQLHVYLYYKGSEFARAEITKYN